MSVSIISFKVLNFFPIFPPGWSSLKDFLSNFLKLKTEQQRASPKARDMVVEVVGIIFNLSASTWDGKIKLISEFLDNKLSFEDVIEIILTFFFLLKLIKSVSSWDSPELDNIMRTSFFSTMPISPWLASTGFKYTAGIPVEVKDAAILPAIFPLFPTPETIILPFCWEINSTAFTKSSFIVLDSFPSAKDSKFITSTPTFLILDLFIFKLLMRKDIYSLPSL